MGKKLVISILVIILLALVFFIVYKMVINPQQDPNSGKKIETEVSDNGFMAYSLSNINISNPNANLIFADDLDGTGQKEFVAEVGYKYSFSKFGEHTIKVTELNNEYVTLSLSSGLAPTKDSGGFSLIEKYDKVTIKKNTGICLNVQATDLTNSGMYIFYVSK